MLGRRPGRVGVAAFGHVDVSSAGRAELESVVRQIAGNIQRLTEIPFHPDDLADDGEVLTSPLSGFDNWFQVQAAWSLELAVAAIRAKGLPTLLTASGISNGDWTFYAVRLRTSNTDAVVVRAKSPSYGLSTDGKIITMFTGTELKPVKEPLIAFDSTADLVVIGKKVYVINPRTVERLFIDADAVKQRAPTTVASFKSKLRASLAQKTVDAIVAVCSKDANVTRRVERLIRDGDLSKVTTAKVRAALPDAGLGHTDFGKTGALVAITDHHAKVLIDIAADLYYQPRFEASPRRVAVYRRVK